MINEVFVTFETAKLLNIKGFSSADCHTAYDEDGEFFWHGDYSKSRRGVIDAPTLQLTMQWLRKKHNLAISTSFTVDGWRSCVSQIKLDSEGFVVDIIDDIDNGNIPNCGTYEQACESAIKHCLENLI